jgi:hypothetical protein
MKTLVLPLVVTLCGFLSSTKTQAQPPDGKGEKAWEVVRAGKAGLAVPKGWRAITAPSPRMVLYRKGDGLGVPAVDETGSPLQIGLSVEKYPGTKDSLAEGIKALLAAAKRNPRLELVGKESVEGLKLADGAEAKLLITEFIKEKSQRSLQVKMLVKDADSNGWVISGFIVGGKDSRIPTPNSDIAKWLRAHLTSFCLDAGKVDEAKVKAAHETRAKKE